MVCSCPGTRKAS
ncbi:hypothetical protein VCHC38A1_1755, partial [Vibrio cholerae HC-38A1]